MKHRKTERELLREISRLKSQLAKERGRNQKLEAENERLRERLKWQRQQKWGRRSERMAPRKKKAEKKRPIKLTKIAAAGPRQKKGPKRFDPKLPRVVLKVDDPSAAERTCPETGRPMEAAKTEAIEVLACVPAYYYVARYERTLWVSPAKCAPVYSPWPDEVFGPSRAHASLLAHIAAERFALHQPYFRLEKHAQRRGAHLARSYQVSLMKLLDKTVTRLVAEIKAEVMRHRYVHVDATPVPACDPAHPGRTNETTIWTFRAHGGPVWYQHEPSGPDAAGSEICGQRAGGRSGRSEPNRAAGKSDGIWLRRTLPAALFPGVRGG
jgi:transposase